MMYNETFTYVSQHYESSQTYYCALPFGVAAYKGFCSECLLVKRDSKTSKIIAVAVVSLWGD